MSLARSPTMTSISSGPFMSGHGSKEFYQEQVEKWKKIHVTHNAEKILLHQLEHPESISTDKSFLSLLNNSTQKKNELQALQQDSMRLLKNKLSAELDSTDWMFSVSNQNVGKANSMWNSR
jgi:hypothetical protein